MIHWLAQIKFSPRPLSVLIMHKKDMLNSEKAVTFMVMVYDSERIQTRINKEKRHIGQSSGETRGKLPAVLCQSHKEHLILPIMMCDNTCKGLPIRVAHLSLGV